MLKAFSGPGPTLRRHRLVGAVALFALGACATTRPAEEVLPLPQEPVDVGYGAVSADHRAGALVTVQGKDVPAVQSKTMAQMLARLPGVRVVELHGGGISVRIRGSSSFLSGEEPLFVLDGMMMSSGDGELRGLNPNTIESITVLKDAGDVAIYGSRGANGVILIKTKSGAK